VKFGRKKQNRREERERERDRDNERETGGQRDREKKQAGIIEGVKKGTSPSGRAAGRVRERGIGVCVVEMAPALAIWRHSRNVSTDHAAV